MTDRRIEILTKLRKSLGLDSTFDEQTPLFSTGLIDSLNVFDVVCIVEEVIGMEIPVEDVTLDNFDTVERLLFYLDQQT